MKGRLKGRTASFDDYQRFFDAEQIHKFSGTEVGFQDPSPVPEKCFGCIHWFLNQVSGWTACEIMSLKKQPVPSSGVCRFWSKDGRKYPLLTLFIQLCLYCAFLLSICGLSATLCISQPAQTQQVPDCVIAFSLTAAGQTGPASGGFDNRQIGCNSWQVSYANVPSTGFSALSLRVESAPDATNTPGTFGAIGGTLTFGVNPNTNTTGASTLIQAYGTSFAPWVQVKLTSATGSGTVSGILLGFRAAGTAGTSGSGGVASSINVSQYGGNNVISAGTNGALAMGGTAATGAVPTANPVLVAGFDGTNQDDVRTDTSGQLVPSGVSTALANAVSNTQLLPQVGNAGTPTVSGFRTFAVKFNGSTWDRDQNCETAKPTITNLSGSGNTQIFAGTAAQNIYLCDMEFSTGTPEDFKLTEGTGANCAVGTADSTALMKNISAWSLTPGGGTTASLITQTAGDSLCANQAGAQAAAVTVWAIKY